MTLPQIQNPQTYSDLEISFKESGNENSLNFKINFFGEINKKYLILTN